MGWGRQKLARKNIAPCYGSAQPAKLTCQSEVIKQSYQTDNTVDLFGQQEVKQSLQPQSQSSKEQRQRVKLQLGEPEGPA